MPYTKDNLPAYIRKKSAHDQRQWLTVWNDVFHRTGSETQAFRAANAAIKMAMRFASPFGPVVCNVVSDTLDNHSPDGKYKVQLMRTGLWRNHPLYGDIYITKQDLIDGINNFRESSGQPFLDYNHGITNGETVEDQEACGWFEDLWIETFDGKVVEPKDVLDYPIDMLRICGEVVVDSEANERIATKKYRFFSPTFFPAWYNKETGETQGLTILGGALTNVPYFDGMGDFVAMDTKVAAALHRVPGIKFSVMQSPHMASDKTERREEDDHSPQPKHEKKENQQMDKLNLSEFGGPVEASATDVLGLLRKMHTDNATLRKEKDQSSAELIAVKASVDALTKSVDTLKQDKGKLEMNADIDKAIRIQKKFLPSQREKAEEIYTLSGKEAFEKIVAAMPQAYHDEPEGHELGGDDKGEGSAEAQLIEMAQKMVKEDKINLASAMSIVKSRNPELADRQREESLARTRRYERGEGNR